MLPIDAPPPLSPAYMENSRWLTEHLSELSGEYLNQWVAIHDGQVIAADPEHGAARAAATAQGAPPEDTVMYFIDGGSLIF